MNWPPRNRKSDRGERAEQRARHYLESQGLSTLACNVRGPGGEIDLVMRDGETLVFVEVRLRSNQRFANACESVDGRKQRKLLQTAQYFLQRKKLTDRVPCRFDVVALNSLEPKAPPTWIANAFGLN